MREDFLLGRAYGQLKREIHLFCRITYNQKYPRQFEYLVLKKLHETLDVRTLIVIPLDIFHFNYIHRR